MERLKAIAEEITAFFEPTVELDVYYEPYSNSSRIKGAVPNAYELLKSFIKDAGLSELFQSPSINTSMQVEEEIGKYYFIYALC